MSHQHDTTPPNAITEFQVSPELLREFITVACPICGVDQNEMDVRNFRAYRRIEYGINIELIQLPMTCRRNHIWYLRIGNVGNDVVVACHTKELE